MFYAVINYQFKTNELKNVEKLVRSRVQTPARPTLRVFK